MTVGEPLHRSARRRSRSPRVGQVSARGRRTRKVAPSPGAVSTSTVPSVGGDQRGHDGKPQAHAAVRASEPVHVGRAQTPGGCAPCRPGRTARRPAPPDLRSRPGPRSTHLDHRLVALGPQAQRDRCAGRGVGERVGHQVADDLPQPGLVAGDHQRSGGLAEVDLDRPVWGDGVGGRRRRRRSGRPACTGASCSGRSRSSRASSSRSSTSRPIRAASSSIRRSTSAGSGAAPCRYSSAKPRMRGQRGAQLVRGVGDELAHPLLGPHGPCLGRGPGEERGLDLAQHRVQRDGEPAELGLGSCSGTRRVRSPRGDRGRGPLDRRPAASG